MAPGANIMIITILHYPLQSAPELTWLELTQILQSARIGHVFYLFGDRPRSYRQLINTPSISTAQG